MQSKRLRIENDQFDSACKFVYADKAWPTIAISTRKRTNHDPTHSPPNEIGEGEHSQPLVIDSIENALAACIMNCGNRRIEQYASMSRYLSAAAFGIRACSQVEVFRSLVTSLDAMNSLDREWSYLRVYGGDKRTIQFTPAEELRKTASAGDLLQRVEKFASVENPAFEAF